MRVLIFSHLTIITLQDLAPLAMRPWSLWVHRAIPSATLDEHMEFWQFIIPENSRNSKGHTGHSSDQESGRMDTECEPIA